MSFLDMASRIVGIVSGIVGSLSGIAALLEKYGAYIKRRNERKEKDPSEATTLPDGSVDDCISNP